VYCQRRSLSKPFGRSSGAQQKYGEAMSRKKMNAKQRLVLLAFFPTLVLGQLFLRRQFGLFEVSIAIGLIFMIFSWLVRDRDSTSDENERTSL
jgi:hypothetical protein